jgi:hypothetical protein
VRAAGDTSGRRAGEVGGVGEAAENHLGRSENLSSVGMGGGVSEETVGGAPARTQVRRWRARSGDRRHDRSIAGGTTVV